MGVIPSFTMEAERMKKFNTDEMINEAVEEIKKLAPRNSEVEIGLTEDPVGNFQTNIKLTTKLRTYFAKKEDQFLAGSFSKALKAMKQQLRKGKTTRFKYQTGLKDLSAF